MFQKLMFPVSSWIPYMPLIGALIESSRIFCGSWVTLWYVRGKYRLSFLVSHRSWLQLIQLSLLL